MVLRDCPHACDDPTSSERNESGSHRPSTIEQRCLAYRAVGEAEREMRPMTTEEKSAMKAACVQAAATLIAARDSGKGQIDVDECITLAALIYVRVVAIDWRGPG
jgi:hypothetical protein